MSHGFFPRIKTELDLNGPNLTFTQQPVDATATSIGQDLTLTGIATASFPSSNPDAPNSGSIGYQWYLYGGEISTPLTDSTKFSGTTTTTLTIQDVENQLDHGKQYFLRADYIPSGTTGNADNDPLDSNIATISVPAEFTISEQPQSQEVPQFSDAVFTVGINLSDNSEDRASYQWVLDGTDLDDTSNISGSKTNQLTISSDEISTKKLFCRVSHPFSFPSLLNSSEVDFTVRDSKPILNYEQFSTSAFNGGSQDLDAGGALTITANPSNSLRTLCVYSREQDIRVKVTMAASAGRTVNGNLGGQGGLSVFDMTIIKDHEYIIKMGVNEGIYSGGPKGGINGGGGLIVIYHKAKAVAVCGGGGGAGTNGAGGAGGGIDTPGTRGEGRNAGSGGGDGGIIGGVNNSLIGQGDLPARGQTQAGRTEYNQWDGSSPNGGRLGGCTLGKYWHLQGYEPCQNLPGNIKFYDGGGTINQSTATLERGFKDGQGHRNNGGGASGNNGGGGGGAQGGFAGTGDGSGGGGASGYRDDEIKNVMFTQPGGNTGVAFITFESYEKAKFNGTLSTPTRP